VRGNVHSFVSQIRAVTSNRVLLEKAHCNLNEVDVTFISFVLQRRSMALECTRNTSQQNDISSELSVYNGESKSGFPVRN